MFPLTSGGYSFTVALADEEATRRLMVDIAAALAPGDLITLSGDLGAGKTTFARALIRHLAGDATVEVPSPTFTLMQAYELPRFSLVHADLYRLVGPGELAELGFEDIAPDAVTLLEWPDRAAGFLPRRPARCRAHAVAARRARRSATRASPAMAPLPRAPSASPPSARFLVALRLRASRAALRTGRRLDARLRAAHAAKARATS